MNTKQSVALASTSALAAGVAHGGIVYSGPLNLQQNYDSVNYRQAIDMTGDGTNDFTFGYENNSLKPYVDARTFVSSSISQSGIVGLFGKPGSKGFPVTPAGTVIDGTYASLHPVTSDGRGYMYEDDAQNVAGDWSNTATTDAYVGIQLALPGGTSYGWLHFIDNPTANPVNLILVDWAYQSTPGVGIQTSVVPEPSACALAGTGIATLLMLRKRRHSV
jgi:hypothetical protein